MLASNLFCAYKIFYMCPLAEHCRWQAILRTLVCLSLLPPLIIFFNNTSFGGRKAPGRGRAQACKCSNACMRVFI